MPEFKTVDLQGMRVALVVPGLARSALYGEWDLSRVDSISPPLGVLTLAAILRRSNARVSFCDAYARGLDLRSTVAELLSGSPDAIGISCMTQSFPGASALVKELKRSAPGVPLIMGGVHLSAVGQSALESLPELDYGVMKEGEMTLLELLEALKYRRDLSGIKGIVYRSNGRVIANPHREFIADLDSLPFPAWDLLEPHRGKYRLSIVGTKGRRSMSLITSRGCPGSCTFCDIGAVGGRIRAFSAGYVLDMIRELYGKYGVDDFLVYDDNFVTLKSRTRQICEGIIESGMKISWSCSARVDMVDEETLRLMKRAGCWQIEYGIESGSQKILDAMNKRISLEVIRRALSLTRRAGIETRGNFIFGYFGETRQTLEESIRFALSLDLDYFQQTFLTPYPGSAIYREADKYGIFDRRLEKMNNLTINFIPAGLTEEELRGYSRLAFRRFYLRPGIILRQLLRLRRTHDIKRLFSAGKALFKTVKPGTDRPVTVRQVKDFWEEHPLLAYELPFEPGSEEFFAAYDSIREKQEFKYCFHLLRHPLPPGARMLDVGCGNGWLLSRFAGRSLRLYGLDLTRRSLQICRRRFERTKTEVHLVNASAEDIPFGDNQFDQVTSLGVIHHTPRTEQCCREIIRVCKPGGRILIAVYYENLFLRRWFYPVTRLLLAAFGRPDLLKLSRQEFINRFDGPGNPLGKAYNRKQALELLAGLKNVRSEVHYFPRRFVPVLANRFCGEKLSRFLDRHFGFLIYVEGYKEEEVQCAE